MWITVTIVTAFTVSVAQHTVSCTRNDCSCPLSNDDNACLQNRYGSTKSCSKNCDETVKKALGYSPQQKIATIQSNSDTAVKNIQDDAATKVAKEFEDACDELDTAFNIVLEYALTAFEYSNGSIELFQELINETVNEYFLDEEKECSNKDVATKCWVYFTLMSSIMLILCI